MFSGDNSAPLPWPAVMYLVVMAIEAAIYIGVVSSVRLEELYRKILAHCVAPFHPAPIITFPDLDGAESFRSESEAGTVRLDFSGLASSSNWVFYNREPRRQSEARPLTPPPSYELSVIRPDRSETPPPDYSTLILESCF